jgi:hypothetical protein
MVLQHLKGIVCLGQGKRLGRRIVTGQRRSVQGWNSRLPGVGGDTPQVALQKKMLLVIDVEGRALIDMAWPLSWTSSQRSLEALERALRLSARFSTQVQSGYSPQGPCPSADGQGPFPRS